MERVPGARNLAQYSEEVKDVETLLRVIEQVLEGTAGLHKEHIVHMDLKPDNILVNPAVPTAKIADLGFARNLHGSGFILAKGTLGYVHPDLQKLSIKPQGNLQRDMVAGFIPRRELTPSWDLYSLGVTIQQTSRAVEVRNDLLRPSKELCLRLFEFGKNLRDGVFQDGSGALEWFRRSFRRPPLFPEAQHFPTQMVRIPELSNVPLTRRVLRILDDPWFQRLRRIRQLGFAHFVYPGANHTRFEHLLGVFHLATKYLLALWENSERFRRDVQPHELEATILAALTHDIGQYPFAHVIEELGVLPHRALPHEQLSQAILLNDANLIRTIGQSRVGARKFLENDEIALARRLNDDWGSPTVHLAASLITAGEDGGQRLSPVQQVLAGVISGPLDCDKLDYLHRDALHTSCPYPSGIDEGRLLTALQMLEPRTGRFVLGITHKARSTAELIVFTRYIMFTEVYWHHAARIAMRMFQEVFRQVLEGLSEAKREAIYCRLLTSGDDDVTSWLNREVTGSAKELLTGLNQRRLYKRLLTISKYGESQRLYDALRSKIGRSVETKHQFERLVARSLRRHARGLRDHHVLVDVPTPRPGDDLSGIFMLDPDTTSVVNLLSRDSVLSIFSKDFLSNAKKARILIHPLFQTVKELGPRRIVSILRTALDKL